MKGTNALWQYLIRTATAESREVEIGGPDAGKDLAPVLSPKIQPHFRIGHPSKLSSYTNTLHIISGTGYHVVQLLKYLISHHCDNSYCKY